MAPFSDFQGLISNITPNLQHRYINSLVIHEITWFSPSSNICL